MRHARLSAIRRPIERLRPASVLFVATILAGCVHGEQAKEALPYAPKPDPQYNEMYDAVEDDGITIPAVDISQVDPKYRRQLVDYETDERPGTIVVDPYHRFLYLVMENGKAMRYGVGVAKAGLEFEGSATIARKAAWPHWTPTPDMIEREPERYGPLADGMEGGLKNPLGARALYLFKGGKDTLYRLHGTTEPWSIGKPVSSGCIRLLDQDIMDLYRRVPKGSKVVVLGPDGTAQGES